MMINLQKLIKIPSLSQCLDTFLKYHLLWAIVTEIALQTKLVARHQLVKPVLWKSYAHHSRMKIKKVNSLFTLISVVKKWVSIPANTKNSVHLKTRKILNPSNRTTMILWKPLKTSKSLSVLMLNQSHKSLRKNNLKSKNNNNLKYKWLQTRLYDRSTKMSKEKVKTWQGKSWVK